MKENLNVGRRVRIGERNGAMGGIGWELRRDGSYADAMAVLCVDENGDKLIHLVSLFLLNTESLES